MRVVETSIMKRLKLHPDFSYRIGLHDIGMNEMANLAGIGQSTLYALQNPETHGTRRGGMHPKTAAKIVRAFCERTGISEAEARALLFEEIEGPSRQRKPTEDTQSKELQ